MHPSSFRVPAARINNDARNVYPDMGEVRREVEDIGSRLQRSILELRGDIERLAPDPDVVLPADLAQSVRLVHARLDRLEREQKQIDDKNIKAQATLSQSLLDVRGSLSKISGDLLQSIDKLIKISKADVTIKRNAQGDMTGYSVDA